MDYIYMVIMVLKNVTSCICACKNREKAEKIIENFKLKHPDVQLEIEKIPLMED